jgi:hypothetical protein
METTLHRQLKALYSPDSHQEVAVGGYRIDAVRGERLIEIQHASLASIRDKVRTLLAEHQVHVVKPLAARKYIVRKSRASGGRVLSARYSPRRESVLHLFDDLVHFVTVFPHPRLTLEVVLTEQEEHRAPQRRRRFRSKDYRVIDRWLKGVLQRRELRTSDDLAELLPLGLPRQFSTLDIAEQAEIPRWLAQKMAFCLRKVGAIEHVAKRGNALVYALDGRASADAA